MCGEFGKRHAIKTEITRWKMGKKKRRLRGGVGKKTEWKKWLKEKRRLRGASLFV